jgi:hypothetical protein
MRWRCIPLIVFTLSLNEPIQRFLAAVESDELPAGNRADGLDNSVLQHRTSHNSCRSDKRNVTFDNFDKMSDYIRVEVNVGQMR